MESSEFTSIRHLLNPARGHPDFQFHHTIARSTRSKTFFAFYTELKFAFQFQCSPDRQSRCADKWVGILVEGTFQAHIGSTLGGILIHNLTAISQPFGDGLRAVLVVLYLFQNVHHF